MIDFKFIFIEIHVTEGHCHICFGNVSGAHKCNQCRRSVHLICGIGVGEEGYGQEVICFKCHSTGNYYYFWYFMQNTSKL